MSGFFPLEANIKSGNKSDQDQDQQHQQQDDDNIITPYSLYLFKNQEIYNKSFELWQQYYQLHHHHQPPHYDFTVGVVPRCHSDRSKSSSVTRSGGGSGGGMNCQDCGNQAKKDCQHMRCRTCCKSRGFHCQTHVKSTWVPAAKRRERQQLMSLTQHNSGNQHLSLMMGDNQNTKRLREDHQRSIAIGGGGGGGSGTGAILPTQHHNTSSGLEVGNFPAELNSPAVFRCVRVSAMDEAEEQLAYQTALNIGGHVFKGILYDHGPESRYNQASGEGSSSGGGAAAQLQQLNLITSGTTAASTATTSINPGGGFIDPSSTYSTPFGAFMAGTQFFPSTRS